MIVAGPQGAFRSRVDTTYLCIAFIRSAKPPSLGAVGQKTAQISYVTRPSRNASASKISSIL